MEEESSGESAESIAGAGNGLCDPVHGTCQPRASMSEKLDRN